MKTILSVLALVVGLESVAQDYEYTFKIKGSTDSVAYLASYYGAKLFYNDTAKATKTGTFVFKGKEQKPGGIYAFVLPNQKYFEFIINEPKFTLETDTVDFIGKMKTKNSIENKVFFEQMQFVSDQNDIVQPLIALRDSLSQNKKDSLKLKEVQDKIIALDAKVKSYRKKIVADYSKHFVAKIFTATEEPEVPDEIGETLKGKDRQMAKYRYFKNHFFDGIDFNDERMLRVPVFHSKIEKYLTKLTVQIPDSIIVSAHAIIEKANDSKEVFRYLVNYITSHYEQSKIMGMDAVFVEMIERYYMTGKAYWMKEETLEKVVDRAKTIKPLLIGKRAPYLRMQDTNGVWKSLYEVSSPITVLFIWDPDCGHCKKAMPKLIDFYNSYKDKNVEVYAVSTDFENDKWIKFLRANPGMSWINVSDSPEHPNNFRDVYDAYVTPKVFVLDQEKVIRARKIGVEQLGDFIDRMMKEEGMP